uniref:NADH-ubiquinone oxidoreductase chain 2 n=1 Tax=Dysmicohermes ingens TaxID=1518963 RepID=A0A0U1WNQ2_9NEOP|nr:NADH dehydrogenase subunit 2 [Dysmicohermes ingens]AIG24330.1 NADH dehydrogenase subunit 2 [Dysmicohermes ingens]
MFMNLSKTMFLISLISGTFIAISANSWLGAWMGLEINLLAFIPLLINPNNLLSNEAALKYFLTQALASSILLFAVIISFFYSASISLTENYSINLILINSSLLLKMGAAPFHFWFPSVMKSLDWWNCLILMTWQKIAPLVLISYSLHIKLIIGVIILSLLFGSLGGLNQTNLRSLMAFSSINHLGWILSSMIVSDNLWYTYFMFYMFLSITVVLSFNNFQIYHMSQIYSLMNFNPLMKFILFTNLLSLGGLPPFLGFLPKLMVIQMISETKMLFLIFFMVITTLITLFFYIRITYSAFMLMYPLPKWISTNFQSNMFIMLILNSFSIMGLLIFSLIYSIY